MSGVIEDEPIAKDPGVLPAASVANPSSGKLESIYKNIENEPLINKIKALEEKLEILSGEESVELDVEEAKNPNMDITNKLSPKQTAAAEKGILNELLNDFKELLRTPYGSLGYLVKSESEQILKLYGVDTDKAFFSMIEGSRMMITSPKGKHFFDVEKMEVAGGGKRWLGEAGVTLSNPAETQENGKLSDDAIREIIAAIEKRLSAK